MRFTFHPKARFELNQAVNFYEEQRIRLGMEFLEEIFSTIRRITKYPKAGSPYSQNTRKSYTNKFPFVIIYQNKNDEIFIVAVAHLARKPDYWKKRLTAPPSHHDEPEG